MILDAAAHILQRTGLTHFNTNAVAERAGVSVGSLYQYFPHKDAIMAALIRRQQQRRLDALRIAVAGSRSGDLAGTIRKLIRAAVAEHRESSLLATVIDHEEARLPLNDDINKHLEEIGAIVEAVLLAHRGELAEIDLSRAARTLPAVVRGVVDYWANLDPPEPDKAEEEAVRAALGYLRCG